VAVAFLVAAIAVAVWLRGRPPAPVVYLGGSVLTMDAAHPRAGGLATEGERIALVGSESEVRAWGEAHGATLVDLRGGALLPGFIDAHGHFPGAGLYGPVADLNAPPIGAVRNLDDLVRVLGAHAEGVPSGEWIGGMGYDDTLLEERRHPTRADLDRVSTRHPIGIVHVSGHLAVVNSRGLEALGIDADTPDPEGGRIRRGPDGAPDGVLEESAAVPIAARLFDLSPLEALDVVSRASELYLSAGVTTAQSGATPAALVSGFIWLSRLGLLPLRVVVLPDADAAAEILDGTLDVAAADPAWVNVGAVKLIADGSIQGYTGYLSRPYHVPPGDDPEYRGYPAMPREKLVAEVTRFHAAGMQVAVHGNGDAAIDDILAAFEAAQRAHPRDDARPIVIHAQMARNDQLDRMRALGAIPSFFSLHTYYWGDRHREIFMGPERAARMSPAHGAAERGLRFTLHADAPVVPMEPLRLVWSAVNRRSRSGAVIGPDERIDPMQALRAVTLDAAYQHYEESEKGSLEVGKLADLVLLDRSPLDDPEHIDEVEVLATVVGGRRVWPH